MENGWKNVNSNPEKVHPAGAYNFSPFVLLLAANQPSITIRQKNGWGRSDHLSCKQRDKSAAGKYKNSHDRIIPGKENPLADVRSCSRPVSSHVNC